MGIQGLLPFLEKATKPCHISEFRGTTVAIDTYCWLHKGLNACAFQLASGEDSHSLVNYCFKYIKLLQQFDIKPILVFDGKNLPAKAETDSKRRELRNKAKQRASELLKLGKVEEARSYLKQSINVTPEMALSVIKQCQKLQIDYIVAPYESDAQLAFFSLTKVAQLIITEDSDLLLFGCSKVFYKLDLRGYGYLVEAEKIPITMKMRPDSYTFDKFRYMCILSGCDYVESLQGIGLKKAEKFIKLTDETNPLIFLEKVPRYLNMRHLQISEAYKEKFMLADATFRHQTVFDPFKRLLVPLIDPVIHGTNLKYCKNAGEIFEHEVAYQVALGNLHPSNHKKLNNWSPTKNKLAKNSIWSRLVPKICPKKQQQEVVRKVEFNMDYEQIQIEDSKKIELELASYFKKPAKRKIDISELNSDEEIEEKRESTSPVLQTNPFLKKISKFQLTETNSDVVVKSRYFSSQSKTVQIENSIEEIIETDKTVDSNEIINISEISVGTSLEALSKIRLHQSTEDETHNSESQRCSDKIASNTNSVKRKKMGTCRTIGLKRLKSEDQPTLLNFFNKLQK